MARNVSGQFDSAGIDSGNGADIRMRIDGTVADGDLKPELEADSDSVLVVSDEAEKRAEDHERRVRARMDQQFQQLKDEARSLFGMVDGRPGVYSAREWARLLDRAGDEIGNGTFIVRYLGAERYLDALTVAGLVTFRQNLIAEIDGPTAADVMMIDTAVLAYYNMLRVQGWIGNAALVFEADLFGRTPLSEIHGHTIGQRLRDQLERLAEVMLPIQDRCHRMLVRSLAQIPRGHGSTGRRRSGDRSSKADAAAGNKS